MVEHDIHGVIGTTGIGPDELDQIRGWIEGAAGRLRSDRRAELLDRLGGGAAPRRGGRALLPRGRGHRAAPRPEEGRAVGHRCDHRPADRRRPQGDVVGARTGERPSAAAMSTAFVCTASACRASSPTRRSSSARTGQTLTIRHDAPDRTIVHAGRAARDPRRSATARDSRSASSPCSASSPHTGVGLCGCSLARLVTEPPPF